MNIFKLFPKIRFYDYTKIHTRFQNPLPKNYSLVFSKSENNVEKCLEVLECGGKVATVFNLSHPRYPDLPSYYLGYPVISGDSHDLIFLHRHRKGKVLGLKAKGDAISDTSGFVVHRGDKNIREKDQHLLNHPKLNRKLFKSQADEIKAKEIKLSPHFIRSQVDLFIYKQQNLLSKYNANPKLDKSIDYGYLTTGLHLAPAKESGIVNLCPMSSAGCRASCLHTAGTVFLLKNKIRSRIIKSWIWQLERKWFIDKLVNELHNFEKYCKKLGLKPSARLNLTSDIKWEKVTL